MNKLWLGLLISTFAFSACLGPRIHGNGSIKTESRNVPAFEEIQCDGSYAVDVKCRGEQSLTIETDENLLPHIKTEVHDGELHIFTKGNLDPTDEIRLHICTPHLSGFSINGSASGTVDSIHDESFAMHINGSSKISLSGNTKESKITINGSGKVGAFELASEEVKVRINGSGNVHLAASSSLDVSIQGSGKVSYKGEPKEVHQEVNGSGSVEKE